MWSFLLPRSVILGICSDVARRGVCDCRGQEHSVYDLLWPDAVFAVTAAGYTQFMTCCSPIGPVNIYETILAPRVIGMWPDASLLPQQIVLGVRRGVSRCGLRDCRGQ